MIQTLRGIALWRGWILTPRSLPLVLGLLLLWGATPGVALPRQGATVGESPSLVQVAFTGQQRTAADWVDVLQIGSAPPPLPPVHPPSVARSKRTKALAPVRDENKIGTRK